MQTHGPWKIVRSHQVYQDHWLSVRKDDVIRPDGEPGTYSVARLMPGVCVLALDARQHVYLTREFHYGVGRVTLEAVSGGIERNEEPLATARRELREELGIDAEQWTELGTVDPLTGSVVSPTRLYLARQLRFRERRLEGTEVIESVEMSLSESVRRVMDGEITHGPSCVVVLKAAELLRSGAD